MNRSLVLIIICLGVLTFSKANAEILVITPSSGFDSTDGEVKSLTSSDLSRLSGSDDSRMASNDPWPGTGSYDENKYLEFIFTPNVENAEISSVQVTHEYRRGAVLSAAKLEIWDGGDWNDLIIALPPTTGTNSDISETKDISNIINTISKINNLKIRFLAYRDTVASSATTSHDLVKVEVSYSTSAPTPTPIELSLPIPSSFPTPGGSSDEANFGNSQEPTPQIQNSTPTPTPSLTPALTTLPTVSPVSTASSPIVTSETRPVTPKIISPTQAPTSETLTAVIKPKIEKSKSKDIPSAEISAQILEVKKHPGWLKQGATGLWSLIKDFWRLLR